MTRQLLDVDGSNLYKYADSKGRLNDKVRAQYQSELTDLMQNHAYTLQAAADRIDVLAETLSSIRRRRS